MRLNRQTAFVFWYGAIAQLGERVLCKHEVVGSIPSGSTTLRLRLRVAQPRKGEVKRARRSSIERRRAVGTDHHRQKHRPRNITSHALSYTGRACGISDIVKRRLIRVWDLRSNSLMPITISGNVSALAHLKMREL